MPPCSVPRAHLLQFRPGDRVQNFRRNATPYEEKGRDLLLENQGWDQKKFMSILAPRKIIWPSPEYLGRWRAKIRVFHGVCLFMVLAFRAIPMSSAWRMVRCLLTLRARKTAGGRCTRPARLAKTYGERKTQAMRTGPSKSSWSLELSQRANGEP